MNPSRSISTAPRACVDSVYMSLPSEGDRTRIAPLVRCPAHGARRRADAAFMPVGTKAARRRRSTPTTGRSAPRSSSRNTYHLHLPPGRRRDPGARRARTRSRAGTRRSSPTPAASRSSRCATRSSASTTTGGRSAHSTTARQRASRRRSSWRTEQRAGLRHRDVPRRLPAAPRAARRDRARAVERTAAWAARHARRTRAPARPCSASARAASTRPCARDARRGRHGRSTSTATRSAACRSARSRADAAGAVAAPRALPAAQPRYFMGIGDPQGILEVIERRHRHVRLRAADVLSAGRARRSRRRAARTSVMWHSDAIRGPWRVMFMQSLATFLGGPTIDISRTKKRSWACGCSRSQPGIPAPATEGVATGDRARGASILQGRDLGRLDCELEGSRASPIIFLGLMLVLVWLLLIMPARRRQQAQRKAREIVSPGEQILTAGGIYATVARSASTISPSRSPPGSRCAWTAARSPSPSRSARRRQTGPRARRTQPRSRASWSRPPCTSPQPTTSAALDEEPERAARS